jgi:hypothetical protein
MLDLIEIELIRVRRMAEQAGDGLLLYFIDIAIIEANRKARSIKSAVGDVPSEHPEPDDRRSED